MSQHLPVRRTPSRRSTQPAPVRQQGSFLRQAVVLLAIMGGSFYAGSSPMSDGLRHYLADLLSPPPVTPVEEPAPVIRELPKPEMPAVVQVAPPPPVEPAPQPVIPLVEPVPVAPPEVAPPKPAVAVIDTLPEKIAFEKTLRFADYKLTRDVKKDYLSYIKAKTLSEIPDHKTLLTRDFLDWIDSDPIVATTVYGSRANPAGVLCVLRSLELDLGELAVRREYTQLALAFAVAEAPRGSLDDLKPRATPFQLVIPGDPREPVDTHAKNRTLDLNDHIINFLEDHEPVDCVPFHVPAFKATSTGALIYTPAKQPKPKKNGTVNRKIVAADVIASKALQEEFNAYMEAHGQSVRIDCGDKVLTQNQNEAVSGPYAEGIMKAYRLFRGAYEAKGRLPKGPDPEPTVAERFAFIMRADAPIQGLKWRRDNRFPLKSAPWPTMTLLAQSNLPLREREELLERFSVRGEAITYGEYTGGIAQQADYQSARRLAPYPFHYSTYQMMLKDGGVCGTMANMGARTHIALGQPSCTAGQPGHCALIVFNKVKGGDFTCYGEQNVVGDEQSHPHTKWCFADTDAGRPMAWYQSIAYAVNADFSRYLDSMVALQIYKYLPEDKRQEKGLELLKSGLELNRYNIALLEAAAANPSLKSQLPELSEFITRELNTHGDSAGCPSKGFYLNAVQKILGTAPPVPEAPKEKKLTASERREEERKQREAEKKKRDAERAAQRQAAKE